MIKTLFTSHGLVVAFWIVFYWAGAVLSATALMSPDIGVAWHLGTAALALLFIFLCFWEIMNIEVSKDAP